jgi:hypothetical protein
MPTMASGPRVAIVPQALDATIVHQVRTRGKCKTELLVMMSARLVPISDPSAIPVVRVGAILVELLLGSIYSMLMPRIIIFDGAQIALNRLALGALAAAII